MAQQERKHYKDDMGLFESDCIGLVGRCELRPAFGHPMARNRHTRMSKFIFGTLNFEPPNFSGRLLFMLCQNLDTTRPKEVKSQYGPFFDGVRFLSFWGAKTLKIGHHRKMTHQDVLPLLEVILADRAHRMHQLVQK